MTRFCSACGGAISDSDDATTITNYGPGGTWQGQEWFTWRHLTDEQCAAALRAPTPVKTSRGAFGRRRARVITGFGLARRK
jgi:hypothetical protein